MMHLSAVLFRRSAASTEGLLPTRADSEGQPDDLSPPYIFVIVTGSVVLVGILAFLIYRVHKQRRVKSRVQGYEPTIPASTSELTTAPRLSTVIAPQVPAPQPAQTSDGPGNGVSTVERHTSVRSIMTLPAYRAEASYNERVIGREGERDGVDVIVDMPTEESEEALREEEMEAMYQIRRLCRQQIEEREQRRVERQAARARNDVAALVDMRARSRQAHEETTASNDVIADLRVDVLRVQGRQQRSCSAVSYGDLGIARHDGSRVRAGGSGNDSDSERMGLLTDAASIGEEARPDSERGRTGSVASTASLESGLPRPFAARQEEGAATAGSSADGVAEMAPDEEGLPPNYQEASAVNSRGSSPPPEYTEDERGLVARSELASSR